MPEFDTLVESGDMLIESLHSDMRVLYGYLHDRMENSTVATDSMEMIETMHGKLYELAQEFAVARKGKVLIGELV